MRDTMAEMDIIKKVVSQDEQTRPGFAKCLISPPNGGGRRSVFCHCENFEALFYHGESRR